MDTTEDWKPLKELDEFWMEQIWRGSSCWSAPHLQDIMLKEDFIFILKHLQELENKKEKE